METKIELLGKIEKHDFECAYGKLNSMVEFIELKKALEKEEQSKIKVIKFDGDLENLTLPYYGFREIKSIKNDKKNNSYSNGMFCVDGETREISFETSWLACNGYPEIEIEDFLFLRKAPLIIKENK